LTMKRLFVKLCKGPLRKWATKITDNLRMFAHQKQAEIKPVNIHELFDKTAALIEHDLKLYNILIKREYHVNLLVVESDEDQLSQVFLNLLTMPGMP